MPQYTATLTRETTIVEVAYVAVEADSKEEAFEKAETVVPLNWDLVDRSEFKIVEEVVE